MGKHWYSYVRTYLRGGIVIYGNGGNDIVQEECLKYGKNTYGYESGNGRSRYRWGGTYLRRGIIIAL
jgi:hypothetical protein